MAFAKESTKERELRLLRRENKREQEESKRNAAEIRALNAEKERILKSLKQTEDELKKTQADVLERFRDTRQREGSHVGLHENIVRHDSDKLNSSVDRESVERNSLEDSLRTVDTTGIMYKPQQREAQTDDNHLRRRQELAKARRVVASSEQRNRQAGLNDKTPMHETSYQSDFAKELDTLERRLSHISRERNRFKQNTQSGRLGIEKSNLPTEDTLRNGKEFAGARLKDTTFRNIGLRSMQERTEQYDSDLTERKVTEECGKMEAVPDKEIDDRFKEGTKQYLGFDKSESDRICFRGYDSSTERKYPIQRNRFSYGNKMIDPPSFFEEDREFDEGLRVTQQDIQSKIMASILEELRIQNHKMMEEERVKIEESWTARDEEIKRKNEMLLAKEKKKMEMYFASREEDMTRRETELRRREDNLREREDSIIEVSALKASLTEREQMIARREESLQQVETNLQEINSLKDALLEEKAQMESKSEILKEKERNLEKIAEQEKLHTTKELVHGQMKERMYPRKREEIEMEIPMNQELESIRMKEATAETVPKRIMLEPVPCDTNIKFSTQVAKQESRADSMCEKATTTTEIRQTVVDAQCFLPKFSPFSGDDPKPRTEASYEEWKYEVECVRSEKEHSATTVVQSVRKSLRGRAKRVILTLGISATIVDIMEKLENEFGNVASGQTVMKEFYMASQKETESVNEWGLRLEEIFQRAIEKGKAREEERDTTLREQFWKSLRSERLKNATRVKYESLKSFEQLRKAVRAEENEMKLATNIAQQQAKTQPKSEKATVVEEEKENKLDVILKRIEALERGRRRGGYRGGFNNRRGQYQNQNNRQTDSRNQNITTEQRSEETDVKEPLKA
ncbi:MAG: hypothetical protein AB2658_14515 [Candidatus Thiodiazotropha endolucinida]